MLQCHHEFLGVVEITVTGGEVHVVGNDGANLTAPVLLAKQLLRQRGRDNFRDVLMFS